AGFGCPHQPAVDGVDRIAPDPITTLVAAPATLTSVTLRWRAPGNDGNVGQASSYDLRYTTGAMAETTFPTATRVGPVPPPREAGRIQEVTVDGLVSGKSYSFAIKAADEARNVSGLSNVARAGPIPPPPAMQALVGGVAWSSLPPADPSPVRLEVHADVNEIHLVGQGRLEGASGVSTILIVLHGSSPASIEGWAYGVFELENGAGWISVEGDERGFGIRSTTATKAAGSFSFMGRSSVDGSLQVVTAGEFDAPIVYIGSPSARARMGAARAR